MPGLHEKGFVESLGSAYHLKNSDGWVVKRELSNTGLHDLISPYPAFAEANFSKIRHDIDFLSKEKTVVALTLRTDALSQKDVQLTQGNWDWFKPFKTHHIANLDLEWRKTAARNALRYEKRARQTFNYRSISSPQTKHSP